MASSPSLAVAGPRMTWPGTEATLLVFSAPLWRDTVGQRECTTAGEVHVENHNVDWETCADKGCIGIRLPTGDRCWVHAEDTDLDAALKRLSARASRRPLGGGLATLPRNGATADTARENNPRCRRHAAIAKSVRRSDGRQTTGDGVPLRARVG